jgi:hypothetical protein
MQQEQRIWEGFQERRRQVTRLRSGFDGSGNRSTPRAFTAEMVSSGVSGPAAFGLYPLAAFLDERARKASQFDTERFARAMDKAVEDGFYRALARASNRNQTGRLRQFDRNLGLQFPGQSFSNPGLIGQQLQPTNPFQIAAVTGVTAGYAAMQQQRFNKLEDAKQRSEDVAFTISNGLTDGLITHDWSRVGETVWMSIQASVIDAVISDPIANALKPILQSLFSQLAGAAGGAKPNARGDVFDRKSFFSAPGGLNSMSEYNPEAVMPLARTATGDLGVRVAGGQGGGGNVFHFHLPGVRDTNDFVRSKRQVEMSLQKTARFQ